VSERIARLEQEQVILGYHAQLNPRALGYQLSAVVRSRPAPGQLQNVTEVVDCRRITGEECFIMTVHVRTVEHLEEVIDRFVAYGQTTTSIVQSAPVPARGIDLTRQPDG
jgi:Lrp/AsnC family transcriptional regulator, leucine-responsive regulatory protein